MRIVACTTEHADRWTAFRAALWPEANAHADDIARILNTEDMIAFMAVNDTGEALGFAEASLRRDYVNGCETSPVAFLEGLYVDPAHRKTGVARRLVNAVADWGRARNCTELASDALIDNVVSARMHAALGFAETDRVVYFRKVLSPAVDRRS